MFTVLGKNLMLNALKGTNPATPVTHAGLLDAQTPIAGVVGEADDETFTANAHGLSNGALVVLTEMAGGAGLRAGDADNDDGAAEPLFVIGATANTFQLSRTPGGTAVNFTTDITDVTVIELVEISGGDPAYARQAIAFNNASEGSMDDSTNGAVFDVPAAASVKYAGYFSANVAGTLCVLDRVTTETFGGQGTYTLTDVDFDLNLLAA